LQTQLKINRIFVLPITLGLQYRLFAETLSDNFRPYITAAGGPVLVLTNPASETFLDALHDTKSDWTGGGYLGVGANFGLDHKSTFGANVRYSITLYPKAVESLAGSSLTAFSGLFLTVTYGYNV